MTNININNFQFFNFNDFTNKNRIRVNEFLLANNKNINSHIYMIGITDDIILNDAIKTKEGIEVWINGKKYFFDYIIWLNNRLELMKHFEKNNEYIYI